ncbi:MAG TPA: hypothetical protein PKL13_02150 [bacterium]|nr:hypothetical protein [bacterium]
MKTLEELTSDYEDLIKTYFEIINGLVEKGIEINNDLCFDLYRVNTIEPPEQGFNMKEYLILTKYQIFYSKGFLGISDKMQRQIVHKLGFTQEYYFKLDIGLIPYIDQKTFNEFRVLP